VDHSYNIRYKDNVNIPVHHFKKQIGPKCCVSVAIRICRLCMTNIYDFFNLYNMFFIKEIDFSKP